MLTTYAGDVQILRALKAGAQAYLLKNTLHKELLETIRAVHAGKKTLSPEASYQIAEHATDDTLTPAEIAVLRLIAAGNANKQIADQLAITEETVKSRVKCILSKLSANDRTHAAMIGLKERNHRALVRQVSTQRTPKLEIVTITTLLGVSPRRTEGETGIDPEGSTFCDVSTPHSPAAGPAWV